MAKIYLSILLSGMIFLLGLVLPSDIFAERSNDRVPEVVREAREEREEARYMRREEAQEDRETRQEDNSRACEARKSALMTRMTHLLELATNIQTKFDQHVSRINEYYEEKLVPNDITVANYDTLLANIETQKTLVSDALTEAQSNVDGFTCEEGDIRTQATQFRQDMQSVKMALQKYRTSIRNLLVAVMTAKDEAEAVVE